MLAKRIIPCLDVNNGRVVKGVHFVGLVDAGDPVAAAVEYNRQGADELVFLDITASSDARASVVDVIAKTADQVFIPLTVGGGIRTADDIRLMLKSGADKVSLNTAAVLNPDLIKAGSDRFGAQCIVLAIDARRVPAKNAGRSTRMADAVRRGSTRWNGPCAAWNSARARSCSRAWIPTARRPGTTAN